MVNHKYRIRQMTFALNNQCVFFFGSRKCLTAIDYYRPKSQIMQHTHTKLRLQNRFEIRSGHGNLDKAIAIYAWQRVYPFVDILISCCSNYVS